MSVPKFACPLTLWGVLLVGMTTALSSANRAEADFLYRAGIAGNVPIADHGVSDPEHNISQFDEDPKAAGVNTTLKTDFGTLIGYSVAGNKNIHFYLSTSHQGSGGAVEPHLYGSWTDVVYLDRLGPPFGPTPPATLLYKMRVDGSMDLSGPLAFSWLSLSNSGTNESDVFSTTLENGVFSYSSPSHLLDQNIDLTTRTDGSVTRARREGVWETTFTLHYNEAIGGYLMNMSAELVTYVRNSHATINFDSTVRLVDITLEDGTSVADSVRFESGYHLSAVPEPASAIMLSTGVISLMGYGLLRRKRAVGRGKSQGGQEKGKKKGQEPILEAGRANCGTCVVCTA